MRKYIFHSGKLILLLICTIYVFAKTANAQKSNDSIYYNLRGQYVDDRTEYLNISLYQRNPNNAIEYKSTFPLLLMPNDPSQIGIRIQHKWLGLEAAFSPRATQLKNRGSTDYLGLHLFSYGRKMAINAYFLNYNGYYLANYKSFDTLYRIGVFPLYPVMNTVNWGGSFTYIFNHKKFSLRSSYFMNEIQKRSAGSFILNMAYNNFIISNPEGIVPGEVKSRFNANTLIRSGSFQSISFIPGYVHTFVAWKKLFFTIGTSLGPMLQIIRINNERVVNNDSRTGLNYRASGRSGIGYNGNQFYISIVAMSDNFVYQIRNDRSISTSISEGRLIVGYRFPVSGGFLAKLSGQLNKVPIRFH